MWKDRSPLSCLEPDSSRECQSPAVPDDLADFFDNAPVGMHMLGSDGTILRVNRAELALLGYTRDEYIGRNVAEFHADPDALEEMLIRLRTGETLQNFDARLRCKDGSLKPVQIDASVLWRDDGFVHARCILRDATPLKQAAQALCDRHAQLQQILDHAPVYVARCDTQRRYLFVNRAYAERFGMSPADIVGRTIPEVVGQRAYESFLKYADEVLSGKRVEFELEIPYDRIGMRYMHCSYQPEFDSAGQVTGWVSVITDVTERRQAEDALRASKQRFVRFAECLPGLAWIKDLEGRYVYANEATAKAFGCLSHELCGKTDAELFPPAIAAQLVANDRRAVLSSSGIQIIETLQHRDGSFHHSLVSKFSIPDGDGKPALVGGMAIDVTDRMQAEQALCQALSRLKLAFAAAKLGDWSWDAATDAMTLSPRAAEIVGIPPGRPLSSLQMLELLHPEDRDRVRDEAAQAMAQNTQLDLVYRLIQPNGACVWVSILGHALLSPEGNLAGLIGVVQDVTERKGLEQELRMRVEELAALDRRKDEFLATLSHELRNPLSPIRNCVTILRSKRSLDTDLMWVRDVIERQVGQLARLLDDLLDVSRITAGKLELRTEAIDLATVVHNSVDAIGPLIEAAGQRLTVSLPYRPIRLQADSLRLGQVISNLLHNAMKFSEPGGRISLSAEGDGQTVTICVQDTGIGIPSERLSDIFEMFVQVDHSLQRSRGGLGIGLTLVKRLVEMHAGTVEARSSGTGQGTQFIVRLPMIPPQAGGGEQADAPREADSAEAVPLGVLIVDDNRDSADSLSRLLACYECQVATAYDGQMAIEMADQHRPDVVLLDIGLPKLSGYEVAQFIRRQAWGRDMTLIALTGWGQEEDKQRAKVAGFDHHLVKPVHPDKLLALLRN